MSGSRVFALRQFQEQLDACEDGLSVWQCMQEAKNQSTNPDVVRMDDVSEYTKHLNELFDVEQTADWWSNWLSCSKDTYGSLNHTIKGSPYFNLKASL